jgi:hypothetical protein
MRIVRPPEAVPSEGIAVFLAGSIEMGLAAPWQDALSENLQNTDLILLNPRRLDWDSSWRQAANEPAFREQVLWELHGMERAQLIVMYLDPATKSPVSLLELGLHARSGKLIVCCPEGFWRKGNVDITCMHHGIPQVVDLAELEAEIRRRLLP